MPRVLNAFALSLAVLPTALGQLPAISQPTLAQLRSGFQSPPQEARLRCYWWWLNGNTDKVTITHDLEQMKAKGFGGALLVDANGANQEGNADVPAGPTFGSPAWLDLYRHALAEADRLGLEITLNITSGWNLGGPAVLPEDSSKVLTWSVARVEGGAQRNITLSQPETKNGFYRDIAVLAYARPSDIEPVLDSRSRSQLAERSAAAETGFSMTPSAPMLLPLNGRGVELTSIRNLTREMKPDGSLLCNLPTGEWQVLRIGYTNSDARVSTSSGAWKGRAIDYMSTRAFDSYWRGNVEPLLAVAKPFRSLKYLATDSWELGGTNWTEGFAEEFQRRRGYDPTVWLPVVTGAIVQDGDASARFLTDLRRTVADLISEHHYDRFAARAAEHGVGMQAESGGPHGAPIDALETFRHAAVPQTEFWSQNAHRSHDRERFFTKEAASAANIYGQRFVAQEGETSIGPQWSESLKADLKPSFDMAITEGMNRLFWHEWTSSPAATGLPGQEYFAGTHLNPKVTWWDASAAFFTYLNRVQFLASQGTPVDDALYFYGDNVPAFVRLKADDPAHVLPGYDYDVANEDALLRTVHVQNHDLIGPSGVRWRVLVLPTTGRVSLAALRGIEKLISQGATVAGSVPTSPTGSMTPQESEDFRAIVKRLWPVECAGTRHLYRLGAVYCGMDARSTFAAMHLQPDAILLDDSGPVASSASTFDYMHRRAGEIDLYFVRNGSAMAQMGTILLRSHGAVELWDAVTGAVTSARSAATPDGRTSVSIELSAFGSTIVVVSKTLTTSAKRAPHLIERSAEAAWTIQFQAGRGVDAKAFAIPALTSWTTWTIPGVADFSGTGTYTTQLAAPATIKGKEVWLAFTELGEIAQVRINGHDAGTIWANPLRLRVDAYLKPGMNTITVKVTNLWINRLLADSRKPQAERVTRTNIRTLPPEVKPMTSGLIGPVYWLVER